VLVVIVWVSAISLDQEWKTCGPRAKGDLREHLIWPATEFSLPMLEHNIVSKRTSVTSRHIAGMLKEIYRSLT